ncbi:DUF2637 domain-containing protein [Micromonospora sp. LZ34]
MTAATTATATTDRDPGRLAYTALLACTTAVGAVTFVLSFVGLRDYAERVAGFDASLSWLVPVGVDGLTLCAVAATMLLRHAAWKARAYAWCAFGIAVAASVAGNLSHAAARQLSWEGHVGAAAWPIFLALASHMVIVVRRNMERSRSRSRETPAATVKPNDASIAQATPSPAAATTPTTSPQPTQRPVRPKQATRRATPKAKNDDDIRAEARRRVAAGEKVPAVAISLGVNKATVYRWLSETPQAHDTNHAASTDDAKEDATDARPFAHAR